MAARLVLPTRGEVDAHLDEWKKIRDGGVTRFGAENGLVPLPRHREDYDRHFREGGRLRDLIRGGAIALLKGQYFQDVRRIERRQDIEPHYFWDPVDALKIWEHETRARSNQHLQGINDLGGPSFFYVVSYGWLSRAHPDPDGYHLARIARLVNELKRHPHVSEVAVFMDYPSLFQAPRSESEDEIFKTSLCAMDLVYGHSETTTLKMTCLPAGAAPSMDERGWPYFEQRISDLKGIYPHNLMEINETFDPYAPGSVDFEQMAIASRRQPPVLPEEFGRQLDARLFTNGRSDPPMVKSMYTAFFGLLVQTEYLRCTDFGWGAEEVRQLCEVLPYYRHLKEIHLSGNPFGDEGAQMLVQFFERDEWEDDPRFRTLGFSLFASKCDISPGVQELMLTKWVACGRKEWNLKLDRKPP